MSRVAQMKISSFAMLRAPRAAKPSENFLGELLLFIFFILLRIIISRMF